MTIKPFGVRGWISGLFLVVYVALALGALFGVSGCVGHRALYRQVHTAPESIKAMLIEHNAIGQEIVSVRSDTTIPAGTRTAIVNLYRDSVCSEAERAQGVETAGCRDGPAQRTEALGRALEASPTANNEQALQASADELARVLAQLTVALTGARHHGTL